MVHRKCLRGDGKTVMIEMEVSFAQVSLSTNIQCD